jgi:signal transduction histidine kinase
VFAPTLRSVGSRNGPRSATAATQARPTVALTTVSLVLCLVATVVVVTSDALLLGIHAPRVHLVLDSVDACIAVLVAYLLVGRFRRDRSLRSLLLAAGLVVLALANVAGTLAPGPAQLVLDVWWPLSLRLIGAGLIAAGALIDRPVVRRQSSSVLAGVLGVVVVTLALLWWQRDSLPVALTTTPVSAVNPTITGHPALIVSQVVGALCFLVAAAAFTRDAHRRHDEMLRWFGPACVLGMFSRLHYMLFPSIYSGWLYTGDLLRTGCYLLLLVGAAREISQFWSTQPGLAVAADRKRVARDLHDGVIQELGFVVAEARGLDDPRRRDRIIEASQRGLDETRSAVEALDRGEVEDFPLQLHRLASQLRERFGVRVVVDLDTSVVVDRESSLALLRIAREAAGNAARHGGAATIGVGLLRDSDGRRLVVHDDGTGFEPHEVGDRGYGLTSMKDRARGLGGQLHLRSEPGRGTTVTVTW